MIVAVATRNPVKRNGIKKAFIRFFDKYIEMKYSKVKSGVSNQPINDEVYKGAENRLNKLRALYQNSYDYIVSCEGGLICLNDHWFNVQIVIIENSKGQQGIGLSQGYEIPPEYVEEVINTSVAQVLDKKFNGRGGVRVLTRKRMTRERLIEDATTMALASFEW
ncbi:MAG: DUF84 family protein [Clostridia bacterium]|nr:DUF84 family protein [Clostridia bacterium]